MDAILESECRDILSVAGRWIFSNIWLLCEAGALPQNAFKLEEVLKPMEAESKEMADALDEKINVRSRGPHPGNYR